MKRLINNIKDFVLRLYKKYENLGYKVKKKIKFIIGRVFLYYVLIELAYLFLLPFIYILTTSMMSAQDYMDPTVQYIPTHINWENFQKALDKNKKTSPHPPNDCLKIIQAFFKNASAFQSKHLGV